jgi:hypothetical protein
MPPSERATGTTREAGLDGGSGTLTFFWRAQQQDLQGCHHGTVDQGDDLMTSGASLGSGCPPPHPLGGEQILLMVVGGAANPSVATHEHRGMMADVVRLS